MIPKHISIDVYRNTNTDRIAVFTEYKTEPSAQGFSYWEYLETLDAGYYVRCYHIGQGLYRASYCYGGKELFSGYDAETVGEALKSLGEYVWTQEQCFGKYPHWDYPEYYAAISAEDAEPFAPIS